MKTASILIVDSSEVTLRELKEILEHLGYLDLYATTSPSEAWTRLRVQDFRCVIASWNMTEMSGLALLKIVRNDEKLFDLPFYLTDSAFTRRKIIDAGRAGVSGLIVKPYDRKVFKRKIHDMVDPGDHGIPPSTRGTYEKGMDLLESENYEEALRVFEQLLDQGESAELYYNIGYIKTVKQQYGEAIEAFRKATLLDSLFAKAYEAMGRAFKAMGKSEEAQNCLNRAAEIYLNREKEEEAEGVLNEILQENPDTINVYNTLGVLYRKKGDYPGALRQYERALKIHPDEPYIHYNIGRIHVDMKDLNRARSSFQKALELDPEFREAREVLEAMELGML